MQPLKNDEQSLATAWQHYGMLHEPAHGTAILWQRETGRNRWSKISPGSSAIPALLAPHNGGADRFISVNEFHGWRLVKLLRSLRACYVDIDGCTDVAYALDTLHQAGMPPPSAVVNSGRGLHLYWLHQPLPAQALGVWQRVQNTLLASLRGIGGDPAARDCTRVLRLVGSVNSKTGDLVQGFMLDAEPWDFRDLCNEVLGYREPPKRAEVRSLAAARARRPGADLHQAGGVYQRWNLVYRDLAQIASWHFLGGIPEGHRNNWLFLNAVALSWFAEAATIADELGSLARAWTPGLTAEDVRNALKQPLERAQKAADARKSLGDDCKYLPDDIEPRYRYSRARLYELMEPLIPSDEAHQLRAIISHPLWEQRQREKKGTKVSRSEYLAGFSDSAEATKPWETFGLSRATYYRKKSLGTL